MDKKSIQDKYCVTSLLLYNVLKLFTIGQLVMVRDQKDILKGAHASETAGGSGGQAFSMLLPLEGQNGFVFGVLQSLGTQESFDIFAGIVQNHLERLAGTVESGTNLTHRFEQLLQALNEDIATGDDEGLFSLPIADTSGTIGLANSTTVVVSGFGNLLAQFMHKSEKEQYDIYDLARGMRVEEEVSSWKKPFLTVLDGELKSGDVLYVGTRISRHDIPISTINEIITTLPPQSAVSKIRQYLPIETVFGAVVLKTERIDEPAFVSEGTAHASIEKFDKTKTTTDRFLSEQKPEVKSMAMKLWVFLFPKRGSADRRKMVKRFLRFLGRLILVFVTVASKILMGLAGALFALLKRGVSNPKAVIQGAKQLRHRIDRTMRSAIARFTQLPKMSKYILLTVVTIGFVFTLGIVFIHREQANAADRRAYDLSVTNVQKKIENAEASLIYGNEDQARQQLNEAWQMASQLPTNSKERQAKNQELLSAVSVKRDQLRHLVTVDAKQVADASGLTDASMDALTAFNGVFYGITNQGDIYTVDPGTESLVKVEVTKGDVGGPKAVTASDTAIYWLDNPSTSSGPSGLTRYIPETKEVAALSVARTGVDLVYYGAKMYILSPESGQVYKHQRTASGFDGGSAWIISGVSSVSDGVALTIDGYIWILKADGTIVRYLAGKETDWRLGVVEPALLNTKDIWTDENSKFLYVLDPNEKRVVVFDKEKGTLVTQYTNDQFTDLKSMIVDEANKKITVLAGSKVYQFELKN